jgi:hypothetical protein
VIRGFARDCRVDDSERTRLLEPSVFEALRKPPRGPNEEAIGCPTALKLHGSLALFSVSGCFQQIAL